jgi:glycosyltransferase involved in cell wall biosynthesis
LSETRSDGPPIHLVVPGPLDTLTGGFIYDRRMADVLHGDDRLGALICLEGDYPAPTAEAIRDAAQRLAMVTGPGPLVIDGLALTALSGHTGSGHTGAIPGGRPIIALIHHPLCDETGLSPDAVAAVFKAERRALSKVTGYIVTSPSTARRLADFEVPQERIAVVVPGLDPQPFQAAAATRASDPVRLLCVSTLSPRKGQDILLNALASMPELEWRLDLVGGRRDAGFAARIDALIESLGLADRVEIHGEVSGDQRDARYRAADLFVLPSHHEGFGMALAEAMSHGLPIVSSLAGAIPETVPSDAGALVPPGDAKALAIALRRLITDGSARDRASVAARSAADRIPCWTETGADFIAAIDRLMVFEQAEYTAP